MPDFGHAVHDDLSIGHGCLDDLSDLAVVAEVLGLVVPRIPLVGLAVEAALDDKRGLFDLHFKFKIMLYVCTQALTCVLV